MLPNIALLGCGAISKNLYLPWLAKRRHEFNEVWVVDPNEHARQIALSKVDARASNTLADITDDLWFVIVASPNADHFRASRESMLRGAHVLIEKPFVVRPQEGRALIELASLNRRTIAVSQTRRLSPQATDLKRRIANNEFGKPVSIKHTEGIKLGWPFASGASFAAGAERVGVIMDIGVHVLDFYHYLFEPVWSFESAIHDGFNGPEGLAELNLKANYADVRIKLSRYHKQENIARMVFENAEVHFRIFEPGEYYVKGASGAIQRSVVGPSLIDFEYLGEKLMSNFMAACRGEERPFCEARSSLPVIEVLDKAYEGATRYPEILGAV